MKKTYQAFAFILTAVLFIAFLAVTVVGCATHYQVKAGYEREARMSVLRGGPALCTVGGEKKYPAEVELWEMILDNWPDYAKEGGLWVVGAAIAWYIYDSKDDGGTRAGDTYITNNFAEPEPAAGDGDGGAGE